MPALEVYSYPFTCADCGYGERGERYPGDKEAKKWDGVTRVEASEPAKAKCPNPGCPNKE